MLKWGINKFKEIEMSELRVTIEKINKLDVHPNADRLELATVLGWQCVVQKGLHKEGDLIVYFPIDVILTEQLEAAIFGPDSKVKLKNSRIRTIKLRGAISQGLVVPLSVIENFVPKSSIIGAESLNIAKELGVTKFEPKPSGGLKTSGGQQRKARECNPNFKKYTNINHFKNYPKALEGEVVIITEKIHGTNFRAGYVPITGNFFQRMWKKLKSKAVDGNIKDGHEFVFGSHNVQLKDRSKTFYKEGLIEKNVYVKMVDKLDLKNKLNAGEVVYGEIYGSNIQKNYNYSMGSEIGLVVFDIMVDGKYSDFGHVMNRCGAMGLSTVPVLDIIPFNKDSIESHVYGPSELDPFQEVREGIVIRPLFERESYMGRAIFKYVSPNYLLLKGNTENH